MNKAQREESASTLLWILALSSKLNKLGKRSEVIRVEFNRSNSKALYLRKETEVQTRDTRQLTRQLYCRAKLWWYHESQRGKLIHSYCRKTRNRTQPYSKSTGRKRKFPLFTGAGEASAQATRLLCFKMLQHFPLGVPPSERQRQAGSSSLLTASPRPGTEGLTWTCPEQPLPCTPTPHLMDGHGTCPARARQRKTSALKAQVRTRPRLFLTHQTAPWLCLTAPHTLLPPHCSQTLKITDKNVQTFLIVKRGGKFTFGPDFFA